MSRFTRPIYSLDAFCMTSSVLFAIISKYDSNSANKYESHNKLIMETGPRDPGLKQ